MSKHGLLIATVLLLLPQLALAGDGATEPLVLCDRLGSDCQTVITRLDLEGGPDATMRLDLVGAESLTEDSFEFTASLVDPRDPQMRSRMPAGTFIPDDFPVLLKIEPVQDGRLSFRRNWTLELITENLEFSTHAPFRLFHAPNGDAFQDISVGLGSGSFRLRGAGASFSEFVIAADLRPVEGVIAAKFQRFQTVLASLHPVPSSLRKELESLIDDARDSFESGDTSSAIGAAQALLQRLEESAGQDLPDVSRPGVGQVAPAAALQSYALTLRQSLIQGRQFLERQPGGFTRKLVEGDMEVEVSLSFHQAFVVDPEELEISAEMVDVHDPALLARLPAGVHVPEEFPVLVRIEPLPFEAAGGGPGTGGRFQSFRGAFEIEIQTDSLSFLGGTPLRLFKAPDGGAFEDITRTFGLGSFAVTGSGGSFSDVVVAADMRDPDDVIDEKLQDLEQAAADADDMIPDETQAEIEDLVGEVEEAINNETPEEAIDPLQELEDLLENDEDVPAVWRPDDEEGNVAGEMLSTVRTLQFSINQSLSQQQIAAGDINLDGSVDVRDLFLLIDLLFGEP